MVSGWKSVHGRREGRRLWRRYQAWREVESSHPALSIDFLHHRNIETAARSDVRCPRPLLRCWRYHDIRLGRRACILLGVNVLVGARRGVARLDGRFVLNGFVAALVLKGNAIPVFRGCLLGRV